MVLRQTNVRKRATSLAKTPILAATLTQISRKPVLFVVERYRATPMLTRLPPARIYFVTK
jgi:hypothetical protein